MTVLRSATAIAVSAALLAGNFADAQSSVSTSSSSPMPTVKSKHRWSDLFNGTVGQLLGVKIVDPRYWYKTTPGYQEEVAPYVANEESFADFMNKYKEPHRLTDQEKLDVEVRLDLINVAPDFLKPEARAKIRRLLKQQHGATKLGSIRPLTFKFAANDRAVFNPNHVAYDFASVGLEYAQAGTTAAGAAPVVSVLVAGMSREAFIGALAVIGLAITIKDIQSDMTPEAKQKWQNAEDKLCDTAGVSCSSVNLPTAQSVPEAGYGRGSGGTGCTPEEQSRLQAEVVQACNNSGTQSCTTNRGRLDKRITPVLASLFIERAKACIQARENINDMCYGGGDAEHIRQISQRQKGIATCQSIIDGPQ